MQAEPTHVPGSAVDPIFSALANPTRRQVVERLGRESASVSELAEPFDMALPSFLQHLRVLEDAGVAVSWKTGRVRSYRLAPRSLRLAGDWLEEQRAYWEARLDQLDRYVIRLSEEGR